MKSATLAECQTLRFTCGRRGASPTGRTVPTTTAIVAVTIFAPMCPRFNGVSCVGTNAPKGYDPSCLDGRGDY